MADKTFSKIVMNGETLIDLLGNTAESGQVLANYVSINSAGISFSGNITTKTTSDITVAGPTVTVPAGYPGSSHAVFGYFRYLRGASAQSSFRIGIHAKTPLCTTVSSVTRQPSFL